MAVNTLMNLENALNTTLALIESFQLQKTTLETQITEDTTKLLEAQQLLANASSILTGGMLSQAQQSVAQFEQKLDDLRSQLVVVQTNLDAATYQKGIDQSAIRDYQIANMSAEELGTFLEAEQKALDSATKSSFMTNVLIASTVFVFVVIGVFVFIKVRKKLKK